MNRTGMPDIPSLMEPTVELLRRGVSDSEGMRERLAKQFKLGRGDQAWRRFVNNHAWALVRLQTQGRIRKIAAGRYELAIGEPDYVLPFAKASRSQSGLACLSPPQHKGTRSGLLNVSREKI